MRLDLRTLPCGDGVGEVRKAAMRWIDLLADLGLGLWHVPSLAACDQDGLTHSGLAIDASLHRSLAEDVEIDDEHITAWLSEEPWRVHHAVHATVAETEGEDWRAWPERSGPRTATSASRWTPTASVTMRACNFRWKSGGRWCCITPTCAR